jgi:hypothetical protein
MGTHYITCAPIAVLGGFLIAFALESSGTAVVWLTFAFAFGIVALAFYRPVAARSFQLASTASAGRPALAAQHGAGGPLGAAPRQSAATRPTAMPFENRARRSPLARFSPLLRRPRRQRG